MKIAILADIHGNIDALSAVLGEINALAIKNIIIAGDFVGYYYHPMEVIDSLRLYDLIYVKGNHDYYLEQYNLFSQEAKNELRAKYGSGLEIADALLSNDQKKWLFSANTNERFILNGVTFFLCHGSPWSLEEYIYPDSPKSVLDKIFCIQSEIIIMGHTHHPFVLDRLGKIIVNPGSVGQPRNYLLGANWAVIDTGEKTVKLHQTNYDNSRLLAEVRETDPNVHYLENVLLRRNSDAK